MYNDYALRNSHKVYITVIKFIAHLPLSVCIGLFPKGSIEIEILWILQICQVQVLES